MARLLSLAVACATLIVLGGGRWVGIGMVWFLGSGLWLWLVAGEEITREPQVHSPQ